MDLRHAMDDSQLQRVAQQVLRGLMVYQPFIIADNLEVGAGYEFLRGEYGGLVCWSDIAPEILANPDFNKFLVLKNQELLNHATPIKQEFTSCNQKLRIMYNTFLQAIVDNVGDVKNTTFADIGCNSGYFPLGFSVMGAKEATGYDRENYTDTIAVLNEVMGARAVFHHAPYNGRTHSIEGIKQYDVVTSIAVMCHLTDTLQHLAFLGSIAKKALFIFTPVTDDEGYAIRLGEPNKYYKADEFPFCFDNLVRPSRTLLKKSMELMGFTKLIEISNTPDGMPAGYYNAHAAILGIRE